MNNIHIYTQQISFSQVAIGQDFMVVNGAYVWKKTHSNIGRLFYEIDARFENAEQVFVNPQDNSEIIE